MGKHRDILLNKFLLASIFFGVVMIMIKEKEGFASHYHNIDELYKGPLLKEKNSERKYSLRRRIEPLKQDKMVRMRNFSSI